LEVNVDAGVGIGTTTLGSGLDNILNLVVGNINGKGMILTLTVRLEPKDVKVLGLQICDWDG